MATLPGSLASRNQKLDADFAMQIASKTFLPFGNVRGNIEQGMNAIGSQLRDLDKNQQLVIRSINSDPNLTPEQKQQRLAENAFQFKQQRYSLNGQEIDYQSQLQTGWQDRLISQTVNAPGRFSLIASQFTQREASHFLQNTDLYNGAFGFGGAGGKEARDDIMFRYGRFANMTIGNISRPEGFLATAMSGSGPSPAMMGGVLRPPAVNVVIHISKDAATVTANGTSQTVSLKGGQANTIHAISNGALELSRSSHAAAASHQ